MAEWCLRSAFWRIVSLLTKYMTGQCINVNLLCPIPYNHKYLNEPVKKWMCAPPACVTHKRMIVPASNDTHFGPAELNIRNVETFNIMHGEEPVDQIARFCRCTIWRQDKTISWAQCYVETAMRSRVKPYCTRDRPLFLNKPYVFHPAGIWAFYTWGWLAFPCNL